MPLGFCRFARAYQTISASWTNQTWSGPGSSARNADVPWRYSKRRNRTRLGNWRSGVLRVGISGCSTNNRLRRGVEPLLSAKSSLHIPTTACNVPTTVSGHSTWRSQHHSLRWR